MKAKRICIDISNIIPGHGGSGGGIATYALNLIKELDKITESDKAEVYIIRQSKFSGLDNLKNIKTFVFNIEHKKIFQRLVWIHFSLPFFCFRKRIHVLHRVSPELPFIKVCKYVCTLHDLMFEYYLRNERIKSSLTKKNIFIYWLFSLASRYSVFISNYTIVPTFVIRNELLKTYKVSENKVVVTHLASEKKEQPNETYKKNENLKLHIGVVASFYPHKGHKKVMQLAQKFIEKGFTNFKISFRGNPGLPDYIEEIKSMRKRLNLSEYVFFVPYNPQAGLREVYESIDVLLLLSEYEGFGLPALEAQANKIPVFCSEITTFREVLKDSACYIPVDFDHINIECLIKDLQDQSLRNSLIAKGETNVNRYAWQEMAKQTNDIYKKLFI